MKRRVNLIKLRAANIKCTKSPHEQEINVLHVNIDYSMSNPRAILLVARFPIKLFGRDQTFDIAVVVCSCIEVGNSRSSLGAQQQLHFVFCQILLLYLLGTTPRAHHVTSIDRDSQQQPTEQTQNMSGQQQFFSHFFRGGDTVVRGGDTVVTLS